MRRERSCCARSSASERVTVFCSSISLVFRRSPVNGFDLRRIEVHRDDADDEKHAEDDVENRDARVVGSAGGQVSPFTQIADAEGEVAAAFKGISKILMANERGGGKAAVGWRYQSTATERVRRWASGVEI